MASLVCRHAAGVVGTSYDASTSRVLVTVKGDGVVSYSSADQASPYLRILLLAVCIWGGAQLKGFRVFEHEPDVVLS